MNTSAIAYTLTEEVSRVSTILYPMIISVTVITNLINIGVLCRRPIRSSSCAYYFLALNIVSPIYVISTSMPVYLRARFGISANGTPFFCRILMFTIYPSALFVTLMLVGAAIDRFLGSSSSTNLRSFSQLHVARKVISLAALLTIVYSTPFIIMFQWDNRTDQCVQLSSMIITVYLSSRIIIFYILGPLVMTIFGSLTICNIRNQAGRAAPVGTDNARQSSQRRTEGHLARMLSFLFLHECNTNSYTYLTARHFSVDVFPLHSLGQNLSTRTVEDSQSLSLFSSSSTSRHTTKFGTTPLV